MRGIQNNHAHQAKQEHTLAIAGALSYLSKQWEEGKEMHWIICLVITGLTC